MNWAVFALRDISSALDKTRYDVAFQHIEDAIAAIIAQDESDARDRATGATRKIPSTRMN